VIERIGPREKPSGLKRALFRMPIALYHLGLGFLFGRRFLLLKHMGRKSGKPRETVLEVVSHDPEARTYTVASGFGKRSDWLLNLKSRPETTIQVKNETFPVRARFLSPEDSGQEMVDYSRRYPKAARQLPRLMGFRIDDTEEDYRALAREEIPFVVLEPR
jgi:deazaflavin-dependent oxidoreductase (nitroreductase family)